MLQWPALWLTLLQATVTGYAPHIPIITRDVFFRTRLYTHVVIFMGPPEPRNCAFVDTRQRYLLSRVDCVTVDMEVSPTGCIKHNS